MGKLNRWITIATVLGALALLAVVLYLLLEPLHRDADNGAGIASRVGSVASPNAAPSRRPISTWRDRGKSVDSQPDTRIASLIARPVAENPMARQPLD